MEQRIAPILANCKRSSASGEVTGLEIDLFDIVREFEEGAKLTWINAAQGNKTPKRVDLEKFSSALKHNDNSNKWA